jgi:hypothetical protein
MLASGQKNDAGGEAALAGGVFACAVKNAELGEERVEEAGMFLLGPHRRQSTGFDRVCQSVFVRDAGIC